MPTFPTITDAALVPFRAIEAQPGCLDDPSCPYPDHIKAFLRKLQSDGGPAERIRYDDDDLYQEVVDLYEDVKATSGKINTNDAKDKVQILKNSTDLLTKLVALREKQFNIRQMAQFQRSVLELLEGVLTVEQRSEFIERMGAYVQG